MGCAFSLVGESSRLGNKCFVSFGKFRLRKYLNDINQAVTNNVDKVNKTCIAKDKILALAGIYIYYYYFLTIYLIFIICCRL